MLTSIEQLLHHTSQSYSGWNHKKRGIKNYSKTHHADVIFIQETMMEVGKVIDFLSSFLNGWDFCQVDSFGKSRGVLTGWTKMVQVSNSKVTLEGIMLEGFIREYVKEIRLLNIYGPYNNRKPFWDQLRTEGILQHSNIIVGGDINLFF